jgi:hypothetical protein
LFDGFLPLLLVLDVREEEFVELLPDPAQRLLPLRKLGLVFGHLLFFEQNLVFVFTVLLRVRALLIEHGRHVMFVVALFEVVCLVGTVLTRCLYCET